MISLYPLFMTPSGAAQTVRVTEIVAQIDAPNLDVTIEPDDVPTVDFDNETIQIGVNDPITVDIDPNKTTPDLVLEG